MNKPRAYWDHYEDSETAREIHTEERQTFTGLYAHGEPLHREEVPFGFHPNRTGTAKKKRDKGKSYQTR